ncbi:MAG: zinc finger-like domain-containing protein [Nitrososphaerota archaeon]
MQQRRDEILHLLREQTATQNRIDKLKKEVKTLTELLAKARSGENVDREELSAFGLEATSSTLLRLRLQGLINEKNRALESLILRLRSIDESLKLLEVCPSCGGRGTVYQTQYERADGIVTTSVKTIPCAYCKGTGRLDLGDEVRQAKQL